MDVGGLSRAAGDSAGDLGTPGAGAAGRRLADASARQARRYGRLLELQTRLAESTADLKSLQDNVARDVAVLLGDACIIFRLDDGGEWLRPVSWFHPAADGHDMLADIAGAGAARVGEGMVGKVVERNRPMLIKELDAAEVRARFHPSYLPYLDRFGIRSLIEVPLRVRGRTTGALVFARDLSSAAYDEDDLALAVDVGQRVALAVDNAELLARTAQEASGHRSTLEVIGATEARYRELLDSSPIPVSVLVGDLQQYANAAALRLFGVEAPEQLLGRSILQFVHPDDRDRVARRAEGVARGTLSTSGLRFRVLQPNGNELIATAMGSLVTWEGQSAFQMMFEDVTERMRAEALQLERERFHAEVLDAMTVHALVLDHAGDVLMTNTAWEHHLTRQGQEGGTPIGSNFLTWCREDPSDETAAVSHHIAEGVEAVLHGAAGHFTYDLPVTYVDGTTDWFTLNAIPMSAATARAIVTLTEITQRKEFEAELAHQASHDPLTGLPNRLLLQDRLERALVAGREDRVVAAVFVDIDHFKLINDSYGHEAGDAVLTAVAERLSAAVRPSDTVTRFAGDEFVVVCESLDDPSQVMGLADRLLDSLKGSYPVPGASLELSVSTGIAIAAPGDSAEDVVRNADTAMFEAKNRGRDRVVVFDSALSGRAKARLDMTQELRYAVERGELELHYQPMLDLRQGRVAGVEALLRWNRPGYGQIEPQAFIPVAEDSGVIVAIGEWVVREACTMAAARGRLPDTDPFSVAVNLSARQLGAPDLVESIGRCLQETGLEPSLLTLELTESTVMDDPVAANVILEHLKLLGVRLSIDDFGTGYSSLAYLQRFPVDELKIDHSFVDGLGTETSDGAIVSGIISLAHTLDLDVVAEGIETPLQLQRLRELGCERAQGFLIAKPLNAYELDDWLSDRHGGVRIVG
jgi:diguanylate cyclase (GGDEF)-like protein/PAS domain S-box-containing protein